MATLRITNLSATPLYLADIYTSIGVGKHIDVVRAPSDLPRMVALQKAIAASQASLAITYSAEEIASGLMAPPQSVEAVDMAPVAAAVAASGCVVVRVPLTAGVGGAADDVTAYAAGALPFKFRVLDAWAKISTAVALSTLEVRTRAAGAGTLLASLSSAATSGRVALTDLASALATPGATEGLFVRRSDDGVAGEVFLLVRPES